MKILKWLGIFFIVIIVFITITFGIVYFFTKDIPPVMDKFFDTLKEENYEEAYNQITSKGFRQETNFQEFERVVKEMSFDNVKKSSWYKGRNISYKNGQVKATMDGKVEMENTSVQLATEFVREDGEWKLYYLSVISKENTPKEGMQILLPSDEKQKTIIKNTILLFLEDIEEKKSFSKTYNSISTIWKNQITEEEFSKIFSAFLDTSFTPNEFQESTLFISLSNITKTNILEVEGTVQIKENIMLDFSFGYIKENEIWKAIKINFDTKLKE
jgi:hypothetical protein